MKTNLNKYMNTSTLWYCTYRAPFSIFSVGNNILLSVTFGRIRHTECKASITLYTTYNDAREREMGNLNRNANNRTLIPTSRYTHLDVWFASYMLFDLQCYFEFRTTRGATPFLAAACLAYREFATMAKIDKHERKHKISFVSR